MQKCYCNDTCYYFKKIVSNVNDDGQTYIEHYDINKCNRMLGENSRKKPCDFYNKRLVKKYLDNDKNSQNMGISQNLSNITTVPNVKKKTLLTFKEVKDEIINLLKFYDIPNSNLLSKLNYYLNMLGYLVHDPSKETLAELNIRLLNSEINYNYIYLNNEAHFSKCLGEPEDDDSEREKEIYENIRNNKKPFEWTKNEFIQNIINKKVVIKKLKKSKKKNNKKNTNIQFTDIQIENENEEKEEKEEKEEEEDKKDEDSEDEEENSNDNKFDIENYTDDEFDNDDNYDDFSD